MPDIFALLREYIVFFPFVALICLLLAGFNLPISEDIIIITGAFVSQGKPSLLVYNLAAIYIGVLASDFFVYWVGRRMRKGVSKSRFMAKFIPPKTLDKMRRYLDKYGIFTFIVCRFIPFGARNTLFFASGIFNLRFRVFALYDFIAAMISVNTLFFLAYYFGDDIKKPIKIAGIILFFLLAAIVLSGIVHLALLVRKKRLAAEAGASTGGEAAAGLDAPEGEPPAAGAPAADASADVKTPADVHASAAAGEEAGESSAGASLPNAGDKGRASH